MQAQSCICGQWRVEKPVRKLCFTCNVLLPCKAVRNLCAKLTSVKPESYETENEGLNLKSLRFAGGGDFKNVSPLRASARGPIPDFPQLRTSGSGFLQDGGALSFWDLGKCVSLALFGYNCIQSRRQRLHSFRPGHKLVTVSPIPPPFFLTVGLEGFPSDAPLSGNVQPYRPCSKRRTSGQPRAIV
jgi:hypothetical protein